ncbi:hypothetical protein ANCCAN_26097 [Ancylostoma caninum]|uniref:Uncharacterized protein n=1 Tax=Ancylostoma caninum TaxID=29170 RepID=A0A368F7M5_ANCCA|nr:hypothetical protein ANCCAN_26097 [Ancylostoma caninum]
MTSFSQNDGYGGNRMEDNHPIRPVAGSVHERLIKSVKHSLSKVMRGANITKETLETLLVEVEGTLNCRSLTYQEEHWDNTPVLRPIDFIQRDMLVTYPFEHIGEDQYDDTYLPPDEVIQLRTRCQAEDALKTSHKLKERFWNAVPHQLTRDPQVGHFQETWREQNTYS